MVLSKRILLSTLLTFLLSGCAHYQPLRPSCKGVFISGDYTDPHGIFSVSIPKIIYPIDIVEKNYANDRYSVHFDDYRGSFAKVELFEAVEGVEGERIEGESIMLFYVECIYPQTLALIPGVTVEACDLIDATSNSPSYFALLNIPEGSNTIQGATNRRLDCLLGSLLFVKDTRLVLLTIQFSPEVVERKVAGTEYATPADFYKAMLLKIKESFQLMELSHDPYNDCTVKT